MLDFTVMQMSKVIHEKGLLSHTPSLSLPGIRRALPFSLSRAPELLAYGQSSTKEASAEERGLHGKIKSAVNIHFSQVNS